MQAKLSQEIEEWVFLCDFTNFLGRYLHVVDGRFNSFPVPCQSVSSESNIDFAESVAVPRHELGCVRVDEEGFHDCSAGRKHLIHLKHDFLSGDSHISRPTIVTELEKVLTTKSNPEIEDI